MCTDARYLSMRLESQRVDDACGFFGFKVMDEPLTFFSHRARNRALQRKQVIQIDFGGGRLEGFSALCSGGCGPGVDPVPVLLLNVRVPGPRARETFIA